ncbi:MAG: HEAT repeat domain-containing protein [Pseudomonadota bacterium]
MRILAVTILTVVIFSANHALALTDGQTALVSKLVNSNTFVYPREDIADIRDIGPDALQPIITAYQSTEDHTRKAQLARLLWDIGLESDEASSVLLEDAKTEHRTLRVNVQYALGSVSADEVVVETLLDNMRNDPNAFFRDKAACALAYNQKHLSYDQKYDLYRGLIEGLSDEKPQVRSISIQALRIHTGQTMGFHPEALVGSRDESIARWYTWLQDYQQSL